MDLHEWLKLPVRDVAATAIIAFLCWKMFLKLIEVLENQVRGLSEQLAAINSNIAAMNSLLSRFMENDMQHILEALNTIGKRRRRSVRRKGK